MTNDPVPLDPVIDANVVSRLCKRPKREIPSLVRAGVLPQPIRYSEAPNAKRHWLTADVLEFLKIRSLR